MLVERYSVADTIITKNNKTNSNVSTDPSSACRACDDVGGCLIDQLGGKTLASLDTGNNAHVIQQGELLFREGDDPQAMYVVKSGSLKTYLTTKQGEEQVLGFHLPGSLLGLDAIGSHTRRSAAIALETSSICTLSKVDLEDLSSITSEWNKRLYSLVSKELTRNHYLFLALAKKDADEKIASFLLCLSGRFKSLGYSESEFTLSMSRQDIASYLGITIETVSRVFKRFQENGILHITWRQVILTDIDRLITIAGAETIE